MTVYKKTGVKSNMKKPAYGKQPKAKGQPVKRTQKGKRAS